MHPLNETVQGLVTDVLCVTHLGSVYLFYVTHYKNTADFLQKARSKSLAKTVSLLHGGGEQTSNGLKSPIIAREPCSNGGRTSESSLYIWKGN